MSLGGSKQPQQIAPTTTTTTTEPFAEQKPFLERVFKEAEAQFDATGPTFFPGQTTAGKNAFDVAAQQQFLGAASPTADIARASADATKFALGPVLSPESNPALQANIEGAIRPVFDTLTRKVLPNIRSDAILADGFGGSRQQLAEGVATGEATRAALDTSAELANRAFVSGLDTFSKALVTAPQVQSQQLAAPSIIAGVGEQERAFEQQGINEAVQRYNFEQAIEGAKLAQFANLIQGNFGGTTTQQIAGVQNPQGGNAFTRGLGGALSGASLGAAFGGFGAP